MRDRVCYYILYTWDVKNAHIKLVFQEDVHAVTKKRVEFWQATQGVEDVHSVHTIGVYNDFG